MSAHNRDLPTEADRLERIEDRLNQNLRTVKLMLIGVSIFGSALLMLVLFYIFSL
jgi:hypothetical protein